MMRPIFFPYQGMRNSNSRNICACNIGWKWTCMMVFFLLTDQFTMAQQSMADPDKEITALVQIIEFERTGYHVSSSKISLKILEVYSGSPEDSVIRFPRLENRYLIDKIFGQKVSPSEILASKKDFVVKYAPTSWEMMYEGDYRLIWAAATERKASLEKLESLLRSYMDELDDTMTLEFEELVLMELKSESYGRFYFNHRGTNYVYIETYPGSLEWILAIPDEGHIHSRDMSAALLKLEKKGRIFYEKDGVKKIAHRQHPDSEYWYTATILE
ncbi:MAG: hypothetical protein ACFHWX_09350 [Bacteroidota bacterium]